MTVEDRYGRELPADDGGGVSGSFHATMTRHAAIRTLDGLVADCMRMKGYSNSPDTSNK